MRFNCLEIAFSIFINFRAYYLSVFPSSSPFPFLEFLFVNPFYEVVFPLLIFVANYLYYGVFHLLFFFGVESKIKFLSDGVSVFVN